jgi:hypothetical protein
MGVTVFVLICILLPTVKAAPQLSGTGIPSTAQAGQPIPISINITSDFSVLEVLLTINNPYSIEIMTLSEGNDTCGTWTFEIPAQPWKSQMEFSIKARDNNGSSYYPNRDGYSTIEILGDDPPKPFPWNWVLIIAFLGVAFVLTELVFKPGFYRATGREKAKALEEEDRKREQEESEKEN